MGYRERAGSIDLCGLKDMPLDTPRLIKCQHVRTLLRWEDVTNQRAVWASML